MTDQKKRGCVWISFDNFKAIRCFYGKQTSLVIAKTPIEYAWWQTVTVSILISLPIFLSVSEAEKEKNEKAKSPPAKGISSPAAQPRPPLTPKSPDMGTEDTTGEHKEDDNSDQVNR